MKIISILLLSIFFAGCSEVKPWEKGDLARPHMLTNPNPANSQFNQHMYQSKEGAFGGYGISSGGCGCN